METIPAQLQDSHLDASMTSHERKKAIARHVTQQINQEAHNNHVHNPYKETQSFTEE